MCASLTYSAPPKTVPALSGCTGVSSGPSKKKFENPCYRPYAYDVIISWRPRLGVNRITSKSSCQICASHTWSRITSAYKAMALTPNMAARQRQCIRSILKPLGEARSASLKSKQVMIAIYSGMPVFRQKPEFRP